MFQGQVRTAVDHKGRTSVPSRFRDALLDPSDRSFVLGASLDPCLVAFSAPAWREFGAKLSALPDHDVNGRAARRWYLGGAFVVSLDGQGRILVPPTLRAWAGVRREVLWVGVGDHVEIWDPGRWNEAVGRFLADPGAVAAALASRGL
jgi:MraZ protein